MNPVGEPLNGQTPQPAPNPDASDQQAGNALATPEQSVTPTGEPAVYSGPERRAQGYLVAEILPDYPAVDGQPPAFDRPR